MSTTRLGQAGIGVKAYGVFDPKTESLPPAEVITRLAQFGIMSAKYGIFLPKDAGGGSVGDSSEWIIRARRRGRR